MRDGGAHCPGTVREFRLGRGEHEGLGRGPQPPEGPQNASSARAATAMARDASASCSAVETSDRPPRPQGPLPQARVQHKVCYCAVPGPRNGLHCMLQQAHPDEAPRGASTTSSRLLEGRCNGLGGRVGQIGEASRHERCPGAPVSGGDACAPDRGSLLWRGVRNRSKRSVGL